MDKEKILEAAEAALGRPYDLGAKWRIDADNPEGPIDCSGFVRWTFSRGGVVIADGSYNQFNATRPLADGEQPEPCDLGFFLRQGVPHHVGILFDGFQVIEARGKPYNKVIFRPRVKWEAFHEFSGWRRMKNVA